MNATHANASTVRLVQPLSVLILTTTPVHFPGIETQTLILLPQPRPSQHWQRPPLRHGGRPESRTEPISDRSVPTLCHVHRQRTT
jgi:hypothetical protein